MGPDEQCGVCLGFDSTSLPDRIGIGASRAAVPQSGAVWVECKMPSWSAQYVVYDVELRRIRAKCHYCRQQSITGISAADYSAPVVECRKYASRIIWPEEYRKSFDASQFVCSGCESGWETTDEFETSARALAVENTISWLAVGWKQPGKSPFTNRSPFYTVSTMGPDEVMRRISLFDPRKTPLT